MVKKRVEDPQVSAKHNRRRKKMTSSRRIVKQNGENQQRSVDLVVVDHDLIPMKQKAMNQQPFDDATDDVIRALTVTRFSRLQVLKSLAALGVVAVLPPFAGKPALAQIPPELENDPKFQQDLNFMVAALKDKIDVREMFAFDRQFYGEAIFPEDEEYTSDDLVVGVFDGRERYDKAVSGELGSFTTSTFQDKFLKGIAAFDKVIGGEFRKVVIAGKFYDWLLKDEIDALVKPQRWLTGLAFEREVAEQYAGKQEEWIRRQIIIARGSDDPRDKEAWDKLYSHHAGLKLDDLGKPGQATVDTMLNNLGPEAAKKIMSPATAQKLQQCPKNPDGSLAISKDELLQIFNAELAELEKMMNETLATVKEIDEKQDKILAWQKAQDDKAALQQKRQLEALKHQTILEGAKATIFLLSTWVSLDDKEGGRALAAFGNTAIQVYQSYEKFADTMVQLGELAKLTNAGVGLAQAMAGAALTGNVVSAVMGFLSAVQEQGPTPEQIILEQIGKLQKQVQTLHKQMHERFDRIEKGLNAILETCVTKFGEIVDHLRGIEKDLDVIQSILADQEIKLSNLGQGLFAAIQAGFRHDYVATFNEALGFPPPDPGEEDPLSFLDYNRHEAQFRTWATYDCVGELEQHVVGRSYLDDQLHYELKRFPIQENVKYLSNWLVTKGLPGFVSDSEQVANPVTWGIAAGAYAQLRRENPKHAVSTTPKDQPKNNDQVQEVGRHLLRALRRIVVKQGPDGLPTPNHELFEKLISNYKEKAVALEAALKGAEKRYLEDVAKMPALDPWGHPHQKIEGHVPALTANPPAPSNLGAFLPTPYMLADYMRLDPNPFTVNYGQEWIDQYTEESVEITPYGDVFKIIKTFAKLKVTATVNYTGAVVLARHVAGDYILMSEEKTNLYDYSQTSWYTRPETAFALHWEAGQKLKARFEAGGSGELVPTDIERQQREQLLSKVSARVTGRLRVLQAMIYRRFVGQEDGVQNELQPGRSLDLPTKRLDGAKTVIDAFITLGMPLALESDDFLRTMLYGDQGLVDRRQVEERYLLALVNSQRPIPLNSYVSLRSYDNPTKFVRHRNFLGELTEVQSELDKLDSTFKVVAGLVEARDEAGNVIRPEAIDAVALESLNFPGHFLSHAPGDPRLKLRPFEDTPAFKEHATFTMLPGFANPDGVTFYALSDPHNNLYIHHTGSELWVHPEDFQSYPFFPEESTFFWTIENPRRFIRRDFIRQNTDEQDMDGRANALHEMLKTYLQLIAEQKHVEVLPVINGALLRSLAVTAVVNEFNRIPLEDTVPPETNLDLSGPTGTVSTNSARFIFSSPDADVASFECSLDGAPFETSTSPKDYTNLAEGQHTFSVRAVDKVGNVDPTPASRSWTINTVATQAPKVTSTVPASNATGVKRNTNLTATFSEKMNRSTLTKSTFKLFKVNADGSTTQITNVTVTSSTDGLKATLNPFGTSTTLLAKSTKYKAIVTTGAKDVAGNPLDQNPTTTGNQQKVWTFKTGLQ